MLQVLTPYPDPTSTQEILTNTHSWLEKAVIGLNLCPFAKSVHVKRQIRYALTGARTTDELLAEIANELEHLTVTDAETLDTTLLIHPLVMTDFIDYHFFLAEVDALLGNLGLEGVFQIASLHPAYEFAGTDPDHISNYTNRSPYPTLHLLREASIDRAVAAIPDAESIYERNIETMERLGHEGWHRLFQGTKPSKSGRCMQIWVDADACPVVIKEIIFRAAERRKIQTTLVANQMLRTPASQYIRAIQVPSGFDVADDHIIQQVHAGDLVVTADIPLASAVIERGAHALNPRGEMYTTANIREHLTLRNFMEGLRNSGVETGGPSTFSQADRQAFANQLDRFLARLPNPT